MRQTRMIEGLVTISKPKKLNLLIVDDEPDARSSLRRILQLDQYNVAEAASLAELFARDDLDAFFCVILDRKLRDGTIDDALPELKTRAPDTDILILTGFTDLQGTLTALRHGAEGYLIKPVNPDELRASLRRIVEIRQMKIALQESEARHRGIFETIPVGILTVDEKGNVESANPAITNLFGYPSEMIIGRPVHSLVATSHHEKWKRCLESALDGQTTDNACRELMARHQNNQSFPATFTVSAVDLPDKRVVTVIIEDITERKQLEKDVLKASEDERQRIAQDLHDGLASHLAGTSLICRMLAGQVDAPHAATASQIVDLIDDSIQQVRSVARGLYPVEDEPEALMRSLDQFAGQLRNDLKIDCQFECPKTVLVKDNGTATHLYRIAQEAVNNALRHGKASQIIIVLTLLDGNLTLRIRDNGCGLSENPSNQTKGIGLRTMAYRAGLLQGTFHIHVHNSGGTEVVCVVPSAERERN